MRKEPVPCFGNRLLHQPVAGQPPAVPREARAQIGDHDWIAGGRQQPVVDLLEITGELIEAVRVVSEQVPFDEDVGDRTRTIARQPGPLEKRRREEHQLVGAIPIRQDS